MSGQNLRKKRILYLHSNSGEAFKRYHLERVALWNKLGYNVRLFESAGFIKTLSFPHLHKKWKGKDAALTAFYDALAAELDKCDIFIHFNGANIHPDFLGRFGCIKIYHCADDPDSSDVLSRPVAAHYDICAISNAACLDMYRRWGCRHVFFWPLGGSFSEEVINKALEQNRERDIPLVFVGSKLGVPSNRFIGRIFGMYKRRSFMSALEKRAHSLLAYGAGWKNGYLPVEDMPDLYVRAQLGVNKHNSSGPVNFRLYDLTAFGVLQVCDCKKDLGSVYRLNEEIIGYDSLEECLHFIDYYLRHPIEAQRIAAAGQRRYIRDYSPVPLWERFVLNVEKCLSGAQKERGVAHAPGN